MALIWKPPPHAIERIPGYIKGFSRRFAQSSNDHRGTPEAPGRVVTLVNAKEWHSLPYADDLPDGDCVWGCVYRIDPEYAVEVKAYLDYREKDGYSCERVDVYRKVDGIEQIVVPNAEVYVGLSANPSFIGAQPLDELAALIQRSTGPSGRNSEYLYNLHRAVLELAPDSQDLYLHELVRRVEILDGRGPSK
ncbi:hypothetical protein EMMF5_005183 [Cystobasidiomycetes sp. EMM_F5]